MAKFQPGLVPQTIQLPMIENRVTYFFEDDGRIPNSPLPVLLYRNVCSTDDNAQWLENCFRSNGWTNNWRDIVLTTDHFHSDTHEVLGLARGIVRLVIGGQKNGKLIEVRPGDVLVLPAGTGHFSVSNQQDYQVVGGYPDGRSWDMMTGNTAERKIAFKNRDSVPLPTTDPVYGSKGALIQFWK